MVGFIVSFFLISGTAKIAFLHHANQSFSDNGSYALKSGCYGYNGNSFQRVLDTHEYYNFPVDLHMSGVLAQSYGWMKNDNGLLNRMKGNVVYLVGGSYAENILPYAEKDMNEFSMWYVQQVYNGLIKDVGWPDYPNVIWVPERVFKDETQMGYSLIKIFNDKYGKWGHTSSGQWVYMPPCIVLDDHITGWYQAHYPDGTPCNNPFKVHQMFDNEGNRIFIVFISKTARDNAVWQDVSNNDNPLHQLLWNLHNSADQEQIVIYGDDWEKAAGVAGWDFGHPGTPSSSYDHNISWMKSQNWIQPVHIAEAVKWWGLDKIYDSDPNNDPPTITVHYATYQELNQWTGGNYDNWYNDFKGTQAYGCGNFADINGNGIRGDYEDLWKWSRGQLVQVQDNRIAKMGWVTLMSMMYETAWHTGPGGQLEGWGKNLWNHTRYAGMYARGATWLQNVNNINGPVVEHGDFDGDGIDEYAIYNSQLFAIFDRRGGRALVVFDRDGDVLIGNTFSYYGGEGDYDDGGHTGLFEESQAENAWCSISGETRGDTAVLHIAEQYDASGNQQNNVTKDVVLIRGKSYIKVNYHTSYDNWTKAGVTPDAYTTLIHGYDLSFVNGLTNNGWSYAGYSNNADDAKACFVWASGTGLSYHNSGKMGSGAEKIELGGRSGDYTLYFFGGRGNVEIDEQGPGDREGPIIWGGWQYPSDVVHSSDSVLVTRHVKDVSGVSSVLLRYGTDGNWNHADLVMHCDNGSSYDFDADGQPDSDLYGAYIPKYSGGTKVEYVIHAIDSVGNESWDNNNGDNYTYTVNRKVFVMDGLLDNGAKLLAADNGNKLYYYYDADGRQLYLAETSEFGQSIQREYIFVSTNPSAMRKAPWGKDGYIGEFQYYLAGDKTGTALWKDENGVTVFDTTKMKCGMQVGADRVLEGVIDLRKVFSRERVVYVTALAYSNNFNIAWALPSKDSVSSYIGGDRFLQINISDLMSNVLSSSNKIMLETNILSNRSRISINFAQNYSGRLNVRIYDAMGRKVNTLYNGYFKGNKVNLPFALNKKGIYFVRVESQWGNSVKKLLNL